MRATGAEGWYDDPYRIHHTGGSRRDAETGLVRDDGIKAEDPAPTEPFDGPPVRAAEESAAIADGSDLRRADYVAGGDTYDPDKAFVAVLDATTWIPMR